MIIVGRPAREIKKHSIVGFYKNFFNYFSIVTYILLGLQFACLLFVLREGLAIFPKLLSYYYTQVEH